MPQEWEVTACPLQKHLTPLLSRSHKQVPNTLAVDLLRGLLLVCPEIFFDNKMPAVRYQKAVCVAGAYLGGLEMPGIRRVR